MTVLTDLQCRTAWAITNIFEGSSPRGHYEAVAILKDGAGISYGRAQGTDRSGTLDRIVMRYVEKKGQYAHALMPFLDELDRDETIAEPHPPWVDQLCDLLRKAAADPLMRQAQDEIFATGYWDPAVAQGQRLGLELPLSYAVLYDLHIQSGAGRVARLRRGFDEVPPSNGGDEKAWVRALNEARRAWLSSHSRQVVRNSVYRAEEFAEMMAIDSCWHLTLPLFCRGVTITEDVL